MTDATPDRAHRTPETARLTALLQKRERGLQICGISGPGGVGKSYLLRHVEASLDLDALGWLRLAIDGSNEQSRGDFFGLIDGQLARQSLPPPAVTGNDYFPQLRRVASIHRALVQAVASELQDRSGSKAPDAVKAAAIALLKAGQRLNKVVPVTAKYVNLQRVNLRGDSVAGTLDEAWELVQKLDALRDSTTMPGPLRDVLGMTYKTRVRTDLYNVTADALITDLSAALSGYREQDWWRLTHRPIAGLDRLLLVLDDFEALAPTLEELLVGALIPRLAEAPFPTLLVILCRDDLEAMHPAWGQHCHKYIKEQIRLAPFSREDAHELLASAGVPEARRDDMFELTQGFPFLLGLLIDGLGEEGASSALFLRKFFDRTTRWMSAEEREWLVRVCYLDAINLDSLGPLFPDVDVERVQSWFEREASIRDPAATQFQVRPLIREKVLRYQELRAPSRHRELRALAREGRPAPDATS
uniref:Orc1-like AAA ATPase domain-containing protein n=1 Tax=Aetherobacter rufus TaxID=888831 RepID=A0A3Q8I1K5_9BACT|nr:hypothetical protein [Aetherobacter rufus]